MEGGAKTVDGKVQHTGAVKEEIFWEILDMLKVVLREKDKEQIRSKFGKDGNLKYKEALAVMTVNSLAANPLQEPWVVRASHGGDDDTKTSFSIREFLESRVDAASSY
jgi:hypothetical protein